MTRFTEEMERHIHVANCIDFIQSLEPNWADAILTGPSANERGDWVKRERRWMLHFARALKPDGMLLLLNRPGWCERQMRALRRAGFDIVNIATTPKSSFSGQEVLIAALGDATAIAPLPHPWDIWCSRVQWGSSYPIEQGVALLEMYTKPGDLVFDPFMGLGTSAMACERTGRRWVGCEVEAGRAQDAMDRIREDREWRRETGIIIQPGVGHLTAEARLEGMEDGVQG